MSGLDATGARRRFLLLRGLRWLPSGLLIPVLVLILLDRGLSLGQVGLVTAAQGLMVLVLELPTGGLADAVGRRRVLLVAAGFEIMAVGLLIVADSQLLLMVVFALQGAYRALESGPLDSWYVDAAQASDPEADIEGGLSAGGVVVGVAIAIGTMSSSALVAWDPFPGIDPLVAPLFAALGLRAVEVVAIATLMVEPAGWRTSRTVRQTVREVPAVVTGAVRTVRASGVMMALLGVELLWGVGQTGFEMFTPARLRAVMASTDRAAQLLGPANAVAWLASALGAAAVPHLTERFGAARSGAALRIAQALTVLAIAFVAGPIGVLGSYVATLAVHGASNPLHLGLLHRAVHDPSRRATIVSANSLTGQFGYMLGSVGLGVLADATTLTTAFIAAAAALAAAAPLYLILRSPAAEHPHPRSLRIGSLPRPRRRPPDRSRGR